MRDTGHVRCKRLPPYIRIQQDESKLLPTTNAVDYKLEDLRAMKDHESGRFGLLDFSNCPIASSDNDGVARTRMTDRFRSKSPK
jgi:hypothetical protein